MNIEGISAQSLRLPEPTEEQFRNTFSPADQQAIHDAIVEQANEKYDSNNASIAAFNIEYDPNLSLFQYNLTVDLDYCNVVDQYPECRTTLDELDVALPVTE